MVAEQTAPRGATHRRAERASPIFTTAEFVRRLLALGYDTTTGVPCGSFADLTTVQARTPGLTVVPGVREDACLGVAAGIALTGRRPYVTLQNSGLGMVGNAVQSLLQLYELHVLLVVSWRGYEPGTDAPEHHASGARTSHLLDALDVPWAMAADIDDLDRGFFAAPHPVALLVRPGELRAA